MTRGWHWLPSGPNFALNPAGILQYKDKTGAAGGITKIKVKPSAVGKGQVQVKGKGLNLDDPAMPLTQPVTAQLQNSDGQCWGHQFSSPEKKNTLEQFKDKNIPGEIPAGPGAPAAPAPAGAPGAPPAPAPAPAK